MWKNATVCPQEHKDEWVRYHITIPWTSLSPYRRDARLVGPTVRLTVLVFTEFNSSFLKALGGLFVCFWDILMYSSVLVTFYCHDKTPWPSQFIKYNNNKKPFNLGTHGSRGYNHDITVGAWQQASRLAEILQLIYKHWTESELTGNGMDFWNFKAHPSDTPPPTRPHLLILPKHWGSKCDPMRGVHSHSNCHTQASLQSSMQLTMNFWSFWFFSQVLELDVCHTLCLCVPTCEACSVFGRKPKDSLRWCFSEFIIIAFWDRVFHWPRALWSNLTGWLVSLWDPLVSCLYLPNAGILSSHYHTWDVYMNLCSMCLCVHEVCTCGWKLRRGDFRMSSSVMSHLGCKRQGFLLNLEP